MLNDEISVCDSKTLIPFLKSSKQDQTGSPPLQKGNRLVTDTTETADTHNQQFQSVFEPRREKTGLRGFRPGPTQTRLHNHTRRPEA